MCLKEENNTMGIFDVFKKNRKMDTAEIHVSKEQKEPESTDTAEAENDDAIEEKDMDRILKWIREKTAATAYRLTVNTDQKPGLSDTKFGGVPYWNPEMEYPRDSEGAPLALLAQLNMKDFSGSPIFPKEGLLQFFTGCNDVYGLDFDRQDSQSAFRVIYHSKVDEHVTAEAVLALGIATSLSNGDGEEDDFPFDGEFAVDVEETAVSIGPSDYRYEDYIRQAAEALGIHLPESAGVYDMLSEEQYHDETEKNTGHWVLGHPYFTQNDPREYQHEMKYYDTLLFQMDSDYGNGKEYEILWGDCGAAGFFVNRGDLKKWDFSKVMYNWDCC